MELKSTAKLISNSIVSHKDIDREKHSGNRQFNQWKNTSLGKTHLLSKTLSMLPKIKEQELLDEQEPNISSWEKYLIWNKN